MLKYALTTYIWALRFGIAETRSTGSLVLYIFISLFSLVSRVGTLLVLLLVAKAFESDGEFQYKFIHLQLNNSLPHLAMYSAVIAIIAILGGLASYYTALISNRITERIEIHSTNRLLELVNDASYLTLPRSDIHRGPELLRFIGVAYPKFIRRFVYLTLEATVPFITMLFFGLILLKINFQLTSILILFSLIYFAIYTKLNRASAANSKVMERTRKHASTQISKQLSTMSKSTQATETIELGTNFDQSLACYNRFLLIPRKAQLLNDTFIGLSAGILLFAVGVMVFMHDAKWGVLITYVASLRFAFQGLQGMSNKIAVTAHLLPQVDHLKTFLEQQDSSTAPLDPIELPTRDPILLIWNEPFSKLTLIPISQRLGLESPEHFFFPGPNLDAEQLINSLESVSDSHHLILDTEAYLLASKSIDFSSRIGQTIAISHTLPLTEDTRTSTESISHVVVLNGPTAEELFVGPMAEFLTEQSHLSDKFRSNSNNDSPNEDGIDDILLT